MGYYVRVFCAAEEIPPLRKVVEFVESYGITIMPDGKYDLESIDWKEFHYKYKSENSPILVDISHSIDDDLLDDDDKDKNLANAEIEEFLEMVEELDWNEQVQEVIRQLKRTSFIVTCQLLGDIDEDGYEASDAFTGYFRDYCDGMLQADGEGFYLDDEVLVEC